MKKVKKKQKRERRLRSGLRKLVSCAVLLLLAAGLLLMAVNFIMMRAALPHIRRAEDLEESELNYDAVLVLGAGIWNGRPSPMLQDRLDVGISLYKAGLAPKMIMSGDHSGQYNEVQVMKEYAAEQGVPPNVIYLDHKGYSTYESIMRAKKIFGEEKVLLVTQTYHLYRALYLAQKAGLEADGCGADLHDYRDQGYYELREFLARGKDFVFSIWQPQTYAEDAPLSLLQLRGRGRGL